MAEVLTEISRTGQHITSEVTIPAGSRKVVVTLKVSLLDRSRAGRPILCQGQVRDAGGSRWTTRHKFTWPGGQAVTPRLDRKTGLPAVPKIMFSPWDLEGTANPEVQNINHWAGKDYRLVIDVEEATTVGVDISFDPE